MSKDVWRNKRVVVSGGSAGIGRAVALQLAEQGADVCIIARDRVALERTCAEMRQLAPPGSRALYRSVDVTNYTAVTEAAGGIWNELGGLDLLLCNQGFAQVAPVHELSAADMQQLLHVNVLGHQYLCKAFAPLLIRQGAGTVMLVSSVLGYLSMYGYAAYSASKWGVVGFAEGLRQEL